MIKYTPHTHAAVSMVERDDQIRSLYNDINALFESIQELLPVGKIMQKYSHFKTKHDRMKDQINYLNRALEDLRNPDSAFTDEANDALLSNIQTQISLCDSDVAKLLDQITKAELDNVSHTLNLKLSTSGIPLDSDLNTEAANDLLFSYIDKLRKINISFEKQYCLTNELECLIKLLSNEKDSYKQFQSETNEMIKKLEALSQEKTNESENQSQKYEKLKTNQKNLEENFNRKMDLLQEASDYLSEKSSQSEENYDPDLINAIEELFVNLRNPDAKDGDIKLILKSIIHLSNLKSTSSSLDVPKFNEEPIDLVPSPDIKTNSNPTFEGFASFVSKTKKEGLPSFSSTSNKYNGFSSFNMNNNSTSSNLSSNSNGFPTTYQKNSSKTPNKQSYHEIIESLQQKISEINSE